jgi:uncharacterized repeat protein (TIGR03803 family)
MKKLSLLLVAFLFLGISIGQAQFTVLHSFNDTLGDNPDGSLTIIGNRIYGMNINGGQYDKGCIYSIDTNGSGYKDMFDFNGTNGANPNRCSLLQVGSKFFGIAAWGGLYDYGCIFSIDTTGNNYSVLHNFNDTDGATPTSSLTIYRSKMYGVAGDGGTHNYGCIFVIDTNGSGYKDMFNFNDTDGAGPAWALIISGGKLFGEAAEGGLGPLDGCLFSIDTNGSGYKVLLDFNGTNGASPNGMLTLSGNVLYGTSEDGGSNHSGTIFSIDTDGTGYIDLHDFSSLASYHPASSLLLYASALYGTAFIGRGTYYFGSIYSINTNGSGYTDLFTFSDTNGGWPYGGLAQAGNILYGTTVRGGIDDTGVIFSLKVPALGIDNINQSSGIVNLYPNPNNGIFTIVFGHAELVSASQTIIEIYNMLGENVLTEILHSVQDDNRINLTGQPSGIYFYRVLNQNGGLLGEGKFAVSAL